MTRGTFARMVSAIVICSSVVVVGQLSNEPTSAATLPGGFVEDELAIGLNFPTDLDFLPDGRILFIEKRGRVRTTTPGDPLNNPTVLNIETQVSSRGDRGMISIEVDPDFDTNHRIYLGYTYDPPEAANPSAYWDGNETEFRKLEYGGRDQVGHRGSRVSSFELNPATNFTTAIPNSEVVVLGRNSTWENLGDPFVKRDGGLRACQTSPAIGPSVPITDCLPQESLDHQIGDIEFGPDGMLYVSNGDAAGANAVDKRAFRSLNINYTSGKVFRIEPSTGLGLPDNPFYDGDLSSNRSKVWASGLRQPYRMTHDPLTSNIYVADTGWNLYEEVNVVTAPGQSFGWPCFEGGLSQAQLDSGDTEGPGVNRAQPGYGARYECSLITAASQVAPLQTWCHHPVAPSCTDGRHSAMVGPLYDGTNYPAQYRGLWFGDNSKGWVSILDTNTNVATRLANDFIVPAAMAVAPDGNIHYVSIGAPNGPDRIVRIGYTGGTNQQPIAVAAADPTSGGVPLTVNFDATASSDPDGTIVSHDWSFGDGQSDTGSTTTHTYTSAGVYEATLVVTDALGATDSALISVSVGNYRPRVAITEPAGGGTFDTNTDVSFVGYAHDREDGWLDPNQLVWTGFLHHNDHTHGDAYSGVGYTPDPLLLDDHADDTYVEVCLTATDAAGLSATECVDVRPTTVMYTFSTHPQGLDIIYHGQQFTTPVTVPVSVGVQRNISVPPIQDPYLFFLWSDYGVADHVITTASVDTELIAVFGPCAGRC